MCVHPVGPSAPGMLLFSLPLGAVPLYRLVRLAGDSGLLWPSAKSPTNPALDQWWVSLFPAVLHQFRVTPYTWWRRDSGRTWGGLTGVWAAVWRSLSLLLRFAVQQVSGAPAHSYGPEVSEHTAPGGRSGLRPSAPLARDLISAVSQPHTRGDSQTEPDFAPEPRSTCLRHWGLSETP